ncbi:hypothetical protein HK405_003023, partial [Cladochytrium tenue]
MRINVFVLGLGAADADAAAFAVDGLAPASATCSDLKVRIAALVPNGGATDSPAPSPLALRLFRVAPASPDRKDAAATVAAANQPPRGLSALDPRLVQPPLSLAGGGMVVDEAVIRDALPEFSIEWLSNPLQPLAAAFAPRPSSAPAPGELFPAAAAESQPQPQTQPTVGGEFVDVIATLDVGRFDGGGAGAAPPAYGDVTGTTTLPRLAPPPRTAASGASAAAAAGAGLLQKELELKQRSLWQADADAAGLSQ